jgi:transposase
LPFSASDLISRSFSALQCASTCCADISSGSGKLQRAAGPLMARAAASYARAASSAVSNVPSHLLAGKVQGEQQHAVRVIWDVAIAACMLQLLLHTEWGWRSRTATTPRINAHMHALLHCCSKH